MAGGEGTACSSSRSHTPIQCPGGQTLTHGEGADKGACLLTVTQAPPSPDSGVIILPVVLPCQMQPSWGRGCPPGVGLAQAPLLSWAPSFPGPHRPGWLGSVPSWTLHVPMQRPPQAQPVHLFPSPQMPHLDGTPFPHTPAQHEQPCSGTKSSSTVIHLCDYGSNMAPTPDWLREAGAASVQPTAVPSSTPCTRHAAGA